MFAGIAIAVLYWLLLSVVNSALHGIFQAALYRYATTKSTSLGFNTLDFAQAWESK